MILGGAGFSTAAPASRGGGRGGGRGGTRGGGRGGAAAVTSTSTKLTARIGAYPGLADELTAPSGRVTAEFDEAGVITIKYKMSGLEEAAAGGLHIHSGTTCENAELVGGHYWTPATEPDPWITVYNTEEGSSKAKGSFVVGDTGYGYDENVGHAVVVHNAAGTRVGCGLLTELRRGPGQRTRICDRGLRPSCPEELFEMTELDDGSKVCINAATAEQSQVVCLERANDPRFDGIRACERGFRPSCQEDTELMHTADGAVCVGADEVETEVDCIEGSRGSKSDKMPEAEPTDAPTDAPADEDGNLDGILVDAALEPELIANGSP